MRAAFGRLAFSVLVATSAVSGCATAVTGPDPVAAPKLVTASPGASAERPRFFVQWKSDLPGLTRRPSISAETPPPEYPTSAARNKEAGTTTLDACVTVDGRLADITVARSSGSQTLDAATLDWARHAKYLPAEINGEAFAVCGYQFDYVWRVSDEG